MEEALNDDEDDEKILQKYLKLDKKKWKAGFTFFIKSTSISLIYNSTSIDNFLFFS